MNAHKYAENIAMYAHEDELYARNPALYRPYMNICILTSIGPGIIGGSEIQLLIDSSFGPSGYSHRMQAGYLAEAIEAKFPGALQKISTLCYATHGHGPFFFPRKLNCAYVY